MQRDSGRHRHDLRAIARRVMVERDLLPDFSPAVMAEVARSQATTATGAPGARDLRGLLWCSIDNDDSLDLDQLSVAVPVANGSNRLLVAVADVDALVHRQSAIDEHAKHNTTSVYTPAAIFPMLPERLSTDLTSLNLEVDRLALVFDMTVAADGTLQSSDVYRGMVRNRAKLAYDSVASWLEDNGPMPQPVSAVVGLAENIRLQFTIAKALKSIRHQHGALDLETIQARTVFDGDAIRDLIPDSRNGAKDLIEDLMISANGVSARFLGTKGFPSLRRVVRTPKRWERIVALAHEHGFSLPAEPDSKALDQFLLSAKAADAERFPELSLSVIKLLGPGEYVVETPGGDPIGHFGLAVSDYSHSTAPNRRFPDLITHRLLKAALTGTAQPYPLDELTELARHCTENEDAAKKVERQLEKSSAALLLQSRIGEQFDAIVTGAADKGTWVRVMTLPVEGRLTNPHPTIDVGHRVRVRLASTDVQRGFIDFTLIPS